MIPTLLRAWIQDIAERGSFSIDYRQPWRSWNALSGLLGRRLDHAVPSSYDRWLVAPNLWGAVVGPPGVFMSPAVEEARRPLQRLEIEALERYEQAVAAHTAKFLVAEVRVEAIKAEMVKAAKGGAGDPELIRPGCQDRGGFLGKKTGLTARLIMWVNDTTVESARGACWSRTST